MNVWNYVNVRQMLCILEILRFTFAPLLMTSDLGGQKSLGRSRIPQAQNYKEGKLFVKLVYMWEYTIKKVSLSLLFCCFPHISPCFLSQYHHCHFSQIITLTKSAKFVNNVNRLTDHKNKYNFKLKIKQFWAFLNFY